MSTSKKWKKTPGTPTANTSMPKTSSSIRVRQSSNSTVPPMNIALDDSSVEDILGIISKKPSGNNAASSGKSPGGKKSQKFPYLKIFWYQWQRVDNSTKGPN
eukprot:scaffold15505_cov146-Skeletonema_dohrnii-CCMP3373.AAC.3